MATGDPERSRREDSMERIEALVADMNLDEKIGQLNMVAATGVVTGPGGTRAAQEGVRSGAIGSLLNLWGAAETREMQRIAVEETRLGVPLLFGLDIIHGHKTIFPVPLAEACAFDADLWERTARAAAVEGAADGVALTFAPMLDVSRDPRWGRIVESPGEDAWVASQWATAKTRGFQGADLTSATGMATTAKHFCAYGAVTAGREYASVDVSDRTLAEVYAPPFAAAIAAGAVAVMPAFMDIAGAPMTANAALLDGWLRRRMGFEGVIVSDYNAVAELLKHGVAADLADAAALALNAGVDIDMTSGAYAAGLPEALRRGRVTMADIDRSVARVLRLKERLGLFDDPYRRGSAGPVERFRPLAREAAARSIVLLTCRRPVLPLADDVRRIAVIGPLADAGREMLGSWAGAGGPSEAVSILDGLKAALPDRRIDHAPGVEVEGGDERGVAAAAALAAGADLVILCLGETAAMSGEAASRTDIGLPGRQRALAEAILALGRPVVVLLSSGRPLAAPWLFERADATLATWFLGLEAGHAIADALTGRVNPSGRLPVSWPRSVGQIPIVYDERATGRPTVESEHYTSRYIDSPATPQFAFGHGLSYSRFVLANLRCQPHAVKPGETIHIAVDVRNEGERAGETTLFLFIRDRVASLARPTLELRGTCKLTLAARSGDQAVWTLPTAALAFVGRDLEPVLEPGTFEIHVGFSADPSGLLTAVIELAA
jgi:beta-glucosidase